MNGNSMLGLGVRYPVRGRIYGQVYWDCTWQPLVWPPTYGRDIATWVDIVYSTGSRLIVRFRSTSCWKNTYITTYIVIFAARVHSSWTDYY